MLSLTSKSKESDDWVDGRVDKAKEDHNCVVHHRGSQQGVLLLPETIPGLGGASEHGLEPEDHVAWHPQERYGVHHQRIDKDVGAEECGDHGD